MLIRSHASKRFADNRSGSALIEFALIAPILVTLLLGMFDLGPALLVRFKLASATETVADIVTQAPTAQTSDIANFFGAGADVMVPFSSSSLLLRITNVASDGNGRAFVYWSCGQGSIPPITALTTLTSTSTPPLTPNLLTTTSIGVNTSYVMVESQYTFKPPAGFVIKTAQTLNSIAYTMPRVSTFIGPTTGQNNYTATAPASASKTFSTTAYGVTCSIAY